MSLQVQVPMEALEQFRAEFPRWVERTINSVVYRLQTELRKQLPKRKRTWEPRAGLDVNVVVRGDNVFLDFKGKDTHGGPLIDLLDKGALPHSIVASTKTLHWQDPAGVDHFARKVSHPGSMAYVGIKQQLVDFARDFLVAALYNAASELVVR